MPTPDPEKTSRLGLPNLMPSQAQKHVTHNEALWRLDKLVHLDLVSRNLATPPAEPEEGGCYAVATPAAGAWTGHEGELALRNGAIWVFLPATAGLRAYVEDEQAVVLHDGSQWRALDDLIKALSLKTLAVNTTADPSSKLNVGSDAVTLSHDAVTPGTGDIRLYLNKLSQAATGSVLFQTGWSGRAEIGLAGTDEFCVKVSADGASWTAALKIDNVSGAVSLPSGVVIGEDNGGVEGVLKVAADSPVLVLQDTNSTGNSHVSMIRWYDSLDEQRAWMGFGSTSNSTFTFLSAYPDGLAFYAYGGNYPIVFRQSNDIRINVHTNGYVGIRVSDPTAPLHVDGAMRVGSSTVATLPDPATLGAGAIIFVPDESGGATLAFSDGSVWRRMQDRAPVS